MRFQCGFDRINLHRPTTLACRKRSSQPLLARCANTRIQRRTLKLKAKFKSGPSYLSFKSTGPGAFNTDFIGSTCTALPGASRAPPAPPAPPAPRPPARIAAAEGQRDRDGIRVVHVWVIVLRFRISVENRERDRPVKSRRGRDTFACRCMWM